MAVSGANWRKPTDGYRTDAALGARCVRSENDGKSVATVPGIRANERADRRGIADRTDGDEDSDISNTVAPDDIVLSEPLAIEVPTETALVDAWIGNEHANGVNGRTLRTEGRSHDIDGDGIYTHYFIPNPGTRRRTVIVE